MATYFFVFGVVMQFAHRRGPEPQRFHSLLPGGDDVRGSRFARPWDARRTVILEHRNVVKKLVFPLETLPANW